MPKTTNAKCKNLAFSTSGGSRTHTLLLALDFESNVSTNSTTEANFSFLGVYYSPDSHQDIGTTTEAPDRRTANLKL